MVCTLEIEINSNQGNTAYNTEPEQKFRQGVKYAIKVNRNEKANMEVWDV